MNPHTTRECQYCGAHNVWDRVLYLDATGNVTTYPARVTEVEGVVCLSCKQPQPLGPSNDTGVEHEIRAAEIAANVADYRASGRLHVITIDEDIGWRVGVRDYDRPWALPCQFAGYLARCIDTHESFAEGGGV